MIKCVSILGSTGSIGRQSLDIRDNLHIPVCALTAGTNVERMAQQCRKYRPQLAVMGTEELARDLKTLTKEYRVKTIQPVDMFPMTEHCEVIVLLKPKK